MSTTLSSLGRLPNGVEIQEDLLTGNITVLVQGRDEWRKIVIPWDVYHDARTEVIREVIQNSLLYLRRREQKLDAVTAKLTS